MLVVAVIIKSIIIISTIAVGKGGEILVVVVVAKVSLSVKVLVLKIIMESRSNKCCHVIVAFQNVVTKVNALFLSSYLSPLH